MSELDAYDYHLPRELIAQHPLNSRADARLLVVDRATGEIEPRHVRDLPDLLSRDDLLVVNDTRVIPARLVGRRVATEGRWSGLYLGTTAATKEAPKVWKVMSKTRGKIAPGERIALDDRDGRAVLELEMLTALGEGLWAARPLTDLSTLDVLSRVGRVPLPPYIRGGEMSDLDVHTYQTVFAQQPGAVAAPTAGLHFTAALLEQLADRGVATAQITLHVGLGTFRPIKSERLADHPMHSEWGQIGAEAADAINECRRRGGRVVVVGTTGVRLLETAALHCEASDQPVAPWRGHTDLFIRPPFQFRVVDCLLTNFHLPQSTLLILARTFGGDSLIRRAYEVAIKQQFRFYSYGDAMLIR